METLLIIVAVLALAIMVSSRKSPQENADAVSDAILLSAEALAEMASKAHRHAEATRMKSAEELMIEKNRVLKAIAKMQLKEMEENNNMSKNQRKALKKAEELLRR